MPVYGNKTYECGFFNNKNINGVDDRTYNARQMKEFYGGIFTDGVKPNADGTLGPDLAVSFVSGMTIGVAPGRGLFKGCYFNNSTTFRITLDEAGLLTRYDGIILRIDERDSVRDGTIYAKSFSSVPTVNDLVRNDDVKEFLLAYVTIQGQAESISQSDITDKRIDQNVCGLITGAYNQLDGQTIYAQWEDEFDKWLNEVKDTLVATATLIRYYSNEYITTLTNEKIIPIGISQYNKNLDSLMVYVNGELLSVGVGYTILDNTRVELTLALPVIGTKVQFEVFKSIDGAQANTIVQEVATLQDQVAILEKSGKYQYNCNGTNDNIKISELVKTFLQADTSNSDYGSYTIYINGVFGANSNVAGFGTAQSPYHFIDAGLGTLTNRKVILDFSNCSFIKLNGEADKYYVVFFGMNVIIKNANVSASGENSTFYMFSTATNTVPYAENCRFWITGKDNSYIARSGTFKNCRGSVTNSTLNSYCFDVGTASLLRLFGGEYYAYTTNSSGNSAVVYVGSGATDGVAITYGVNCPQVARGGYAQTHAIYCLTNNAKCSFTDTITTLTMAAEGQNIRGTIAVSKPNMM